MQFANFDEFWAAFGRLYDETLEIKESIQASDKAAEKGRESMRNLAEATGRLLSAVEKNQQVVESHERRQDRAEVTVEAILEDLRRHREQRPSQ
jgi:methyl-accepting chemotaxis protein